MNRSGARSLHHGSAKVLIYFTSKVRWDIYANLLGKTEHLKKKKKGLLSTLCFMFSPFMFQLHFLLCFLEHLFKIV